MHRCKTILTRSRRSSTGIWSWCPGWARLKLSPMEGRTGMDGAMVTQTQHELKRRVMSCFMILLYQVPGAVHVLPGTCYATAAVVPVLLYFGKSRWYGVYRIWTGVHAFLGLEVLLVQQFYSCHLSFLKLKLLACGSWFVAALCWLVGRSVVPCAGSDTIRGFLVFPPVRLVQACLLYTSPSPRD